MRSQIDEEQWRRLSPHLDRALELEPDARAEWLSGLDGTEPALADTLRELLAEKDALDSRSFLEDSPADFLGRGTLAGQRIGAYEIDRLIGQGGMGTVWLARRCDGRFEGYAAVKLLNAALIGRPAEQRFIREGSVLARLQHPNIAHLIDAGVTANGQPYLILEHIEGSCIDDYCESSALDTHERLRVFLDALEAVAYAHRHLVVHRDLKPSNILVTREGMVKLLDFGIATLLEPALGVQADRECTYEIGAALTPEYAAPEQLTGGPVTTGTDVYALGRVLYVLLGGPRAAIPQGRSAAALMRDTLEHELPPLSSLASEPGARRLLRGDLDNIVMKALKKEPRERYATVAAFADDLRRHLAHEPVSARGDAFGYRAGKFVRRHRGGVLTGIVTGMALVATTIFALLQMLEAQHQRDQAQEQRQRAEGFSTAMTGLLSQVGPGGRALTPEELLQRAVEQVEATYADDPAFLVHMLSLISGRYFDLQNTNQEYATLLKAETVARRSGDPLLIFQVQCNTVETELAAGRKAAAQRRLDEALGLLPVIQNVPALNHATCLRAKSEIARADGDMAGSLEHLEEARLVLEAGGLTAGNVYGGILSALAVFNAQAGHVLTGHDYSLQLVELDKRMGRQNSMPGQIARMSLATSFHRLGQVRRALSVFRETVPDRSPTEPGRPVGFGKVPYGMILARLGRHEAGLEMIREAVVEMDESGHQDYRIRARIGLAQGLFFASRFTEAETVLADAVSLMRLDEVKYGPLLVDAHRLRGDILVAAGRVSEAAEEVSAALQRHQTAGQDEPRMARILLTQARVRLAQGEIQPAVDSARAAAELFRKHTLDPEQSADVGEALLVLAQAEQAAGDAKGSGRSLERAGVSLRNGLGPGHELSLLSERLSAQLH